MYHVEVNSFALRADNNGEEENIGTALYRANSIFDHSCTPNATTIFSGNLILLTLDPLGFSYNAVSWCWTFFQERSCSSSPWSRAPPWSWAASSSPTWTRPRPGRPGGTDSRTPGEFTYFAGDLTVWNWEEREDLKDNIYLIFQCVHFSSRFNRIFKVKIVDCWQNYKLLMSFIEGLKTSTGFESQISKI